MAEKPTRLPAEWEKEIKLLDVPEEFRGLARQIGLTSLLAVMRHFEGDKVYFPRLDGAFKKVRDAAIHREWRQTRNSGTIAQRHNLTAERVRQIVGENEDQLSLLP